jgi:glutamate formiminotransferase/formiminotetrahydrofolate cyclodeaminase
MESRLSELTVRELLERLATDDPVPGGGSASALAGALGASLLQMVVALTAGRPAAAGHDDELTEIRLRAATLTSELLRLSELDAAAYAAVVAARRLPKDTDVERLARTRQVEAATREATAVPLEVARRAEQVIALAERLTPIGNRNAISDAGVAALLAAASLRGAALNVRINLPYLPETEPLRREAATELDGLLDRIDERERAVRDAVAERLG